MSERDEIRERARQVTNNKRYAEMLTIFAAAEIERATPKPCVWRHQLGIMGYPGCMEDRHPSPQNGPYCPYCGGKIEDKPADSGDDANPAKEGAITNPE